ncbi:peptidoglycan recognition protein family protein [Saccharopolyspora rosea]|uniref:N-acetylmuramoyl-L-alanine amidase n=1 Tax=Saccharopolyspora rosea TaxID=524884 RepID=A0ABW3FM78_9PSEU|nr:N-acetylmuramoyl-L-alanine amidase [Saccharopolyspora rosea]
MIDFARILRAAGITVVTTPGWEQRGVRGAFAPVGVLNHHTATRSSAARPAPTVNVCVEGRPDLSGPLCHLLIGADGTVHVIAAGRANHAGKARASGPNPAGDGNTLYIGVEWDYSGDEAPSQAQYDTAVRVSAALLRHLGRPPEAARGHRETSVTGKVDPGHVDLDRFRADVAHALRGEDELNLDDEFTDWNGTRKTIKGLFDDLDRRLAALHHVFLDPAAEPSRIPGDRNRTNLRDAIMDSTAKILGDAGGGGAPQPEQVPPVPLPHPVPEPGDTASAPDAAPSRAPAPEAPRNETKPVPPRRRVPERNVTAASLAGAAGTVATWISSLYGVHMPEPVSAAVVLLLTGATAWLVPPARQEVTR